MSGTGKFMHFVPTQERGLCFFGGGSTGKGHETPSYFEKEISIFRTPLSGVGDTGIVSRPLGKKKPAF